MACPQPVICTKKVFDNQSIVKVEALVDDEICVANLQRLARSLKANFSASKQADHYKVEIARTSSLEPAPEPTPSDNTFVASQSAAAPATVVFLTRDQLGEGDAEFGRTLLNVFLQTMYETGHQPKAILLANAGVKLLSADSSTAKVLNDFKAAGTEVLACGLCVKFYGLETQIPAEQITSMFAIVEYIAAADKVLSP